MRRKNTTTEMMKSYLTESLLILLKSKPYSEISIKEIAGKAGVNRSSYYRNFDSKEAIVIHYYASLLRDFREGVRGFSEMEAYLRSMFSWFFDQKDRLLLLHRQQLSHLLLRALNSVFLETGAKDHLNRQFSIYYHTGGIFNTFLFWFEKDMEIPPSVMASLSISFLPQDFVPMLL